jgi:hypothetical protein
MTVGDKPTSQILLEIGFSLFAFIAVIRLLLNAFADLKFYRNNGWDFSKDSGLDLHYGYAGATGGPLSNRMRLFVGYPFLILCLSGFLVMIAYSWV